MLSERLSVFLRHKIVIAVRLLRRWRPTSLYVALASARRAARGASASRNAVVTAPPQLEDGGLFGTSARKICELSASLRFQDICALLALGLHLPAHGFGTRINRRGNVLDFGTRSDLEPHRGRGA